MPERIKVPLLIANCVAGKDTSKKGQQMGSSGAISVLLYLLGIGRTIISGSCKSSE
jgi:hypothetical protein